ncbi:hypothetical protein GCM10017044_19260 [Kordiimonas sediminis]|uniref:J domain-containing protein n=1 Tax=Kordiimonas sediminis TaxID=1735581 RepID=A0A919AUV5_9PROT|nr:DnaJ domain-containing protein [Kordiimonas sediminis]GHF24721.1 hypothetical protein GCM10017044_19260 [Kordiimonas sediminis]
MIGYLLFGLILAGLLLLFLQWWANAELESAKRAFFWAILLICGLLAAVFLAAGKGIIAVVPAGFALWRMLSQRKESGGKRGQHGSGQTSSGPTNSSMTYNEAFEILGLKPGASQEEIEKAYKRLISLNHPDKGGSDWMAGKLNEARRILLDK